MPKANAFVHARRTRLSAGDGDITRVLDDVHTPQVLFIDCTNTTQKGSASIVAGDTVDKMFQSVTVGVSDCV
jgi:hypothetical protein